MKLPLILLHGALGSKRYFQQLKLDLQSDFEVYDLNFEGHGGKPSNSEFTIDLFATNLIDFIVAKNLSNVLVFGYSMGGYVALTVAKKRPDLIAKIVTLGTKFAWSPAIAEKEIRMLNPEIIEEKVPKFAANLMALHEPADWKEVMHKTADLMHGLGEGKGLNDVDLQSIQIPVVIGIGSADKMVSYAESEHAANQLPNGTLFTLVDAPHPIEMVDHQTLLNFIITRFSTLN